MLIKMLAAVALSGALWMAGDAAYQNFGCCSGSSECCYPPRECCFGATTPTAHNCCTEAKANCCAQEGTSCCDASIVYCTRTDEFYEGCCCEIVDGRHLCLVTGE